MICLYSTHCFSLHRWQLFGCWFPWQLHLYLQRDRGGSALHTLRKVHGKPSMLEQMCLHLWVFFVMVYLTMCNFQWHLHLNRSSKQFLEAFPLSLLLQGHSSFITHLDWSKDGKYIMSNSGDYEILYCKSYTLHLNFPFHLVRKLSLSALSFLFCFDFCLSAICVFLVHILCFVKACLQKQKSVLHLPQAPLCLREMA